MGEKEKISAQRRRRGLAGGPSGRAETPQKRRPGPSMGGGLPGIQAPSSSSGGNLQLPGRKGVLSCLSIFVLLCIAVIYFIFSGGLPDLEGFDSSGYESVPIANSQPTEIVEAFQPPITSGSVTGQTWLVMLYQDADDQVLERDIFLDLNEAERVGSSDQVHIVAQLDRYQGGFNGDGNWAGAKRYYLTQDDDLTRINSKLVADLGEVNMSAAETLVDFVTWSVENFPADRYVLIMSDHGLGWPGGWSDPTSFGGDTDIPLASRLGNQLYLMELEQALGEIRTQTGIDKFDVIGLDACLMGQLEVFNALQPHARYAVASEEVEPGLGWAYAGFLGALEDNPGADSATLSQWIVQSYIDFDERINDPQERANFLTQGSPMGGLLGYSDVPKDQLALQIGQKATLTAVDLEQIPAVVDSLNDLVYTLQKFNQSGIAGARSYTRSYTSIFGSQVPSPYIDLGHFVQILLQSGSDSELQQNGKALLSAIDRAVIAEKHGAKSSGSTGISIYFPNSQLYKTSIAGAESYTAIARSFAEDSLWDDFLAFHYTGNSFEPGLGRVAAPDSTAITRTPGAGQVYVSNIVRSSQSTSPGNPVTFSIDISGENIGYIYFFTGFLDQAANAILMADMDYLESSQTQAVNGVYYPLWADGKEFTLEFEWDPVVFAVNDGQTSATALFQPESYGASFEEAIYAVDGTYTYSDGQSAYARLYFSNGALIQVVGFTGSEETGAPREITPQPGDTFTIREKWLDLDASGNVSSTSFQDGQTISFDNQALSWQDLYAAAGQYVVGFVIEDMDGQTYEVYTDITVE
ncbi:MAG: hypothetical protein JXA13_15220 [Anaerolineales bacterium]|nr:hypothetical protein [Anaerolineales bacterium]